MIDHFLFQAFDLTGDVFFAHVLDLRFLELQFLRLFARFFTVNAVNQIFDALDHAARRDVVGHIERKLLVSTALGFPHGFFHGVRDAVSVQNRPPVEVTGRPANGLDQAALGAQKTLFISIQNGDQTDFGNVQALAQQVDTHQHIKGAQAQVAQNLDPLYRVHVTVQIAHLHAVVGQVVGELLGHALSERGDQHALIFVNANADFLQHIVNLMGRRPHLDLWVNQTCGPDHLLNHATRMRDLVGGRRGRYKHRLPHLGLKLFKLEWPVVQRAGQAKTVSHQGGLARPVTVVHGVELADHDVAFVQKHHCVLGQVVAQGRRR